MRKFWLWQSVTWSYWDGHAVTVLMMFLPAVFELVGLLVGWGRKKVPKEGRRRTQSEPIQMLWLITNKFGVTCQCWWWWWRRDEIGRPETSHSSSFVRQCDKEGRAQLYDRQTNETYERGSTFLIGRKEGKQLSCFHHHHQHWLILLPAFLFLCKLPPTIALTRYVTSIGGH